MILRIFFFVVILLFKSQPWSLADDIKDFEIEGMSIGDSLNKFFDENDINEAIDESYEDRIYITKSFYNIDLKNYEALQISYKANDSKKIIVSIAGVISYPEGINACKKQMYNISDELSEIFPLAIKKDWGKYKSNNNEGHYFPITFDLEDGSTAMVSCHDWNENIEIIDNLKITLFETKYSEYLKQKN